jgi:hypothetical protein
VAVGACVVLIVNGANVGNVQRVGGVNGSVPILLLSISVVIEVVHSPGRVPALSSVVEIRVVEVEV